MSTPQDEFVDHKDIISSTSQSNSKKTLEKRWHTTQSFTNVSDKEYEGMFDSEVYIVGAGETESFPLPLAEHLAAHLASKIMTDEGKIPSNHISEYNAIVGRILGKETVDYSTLSYSELKKLADNKGIQTTKAGGKLAPREDIIAKLSRI